MMLDSFAWMEYFMGTPEGEKAQERTDFIIKRCAVVAFDVKIAVEAAKIHAENRVKSSDFGLADAIILASARSRKIKVLTGDPCFKDFKDAVML
jgi:predicted nucleic acid-binding protein